ncbi:hypothetical protein ACWAT4_41925 (plasmid) [Bradyrhizobium manausense]
MSGANNEQLRPPPSWDKFEEICADHFLRICKDNQHDRAGQGNSASMTTARIAELMRDEA